VSQREGEALTARQAEFLAAVYDLSRHGEGVHYSQVAARLGVSRWTAYDVLSCLAQKGFLRVEREQRPEPSLVGRCRVLFRPVQGPPVGGRRERVSPYPGVAAGDREAASSGNWEGGASGYGREAQREAEMADWWEERLLRLRHDIRERGVWAVLHEVLAELAGATQPAIFCAAVSLSLVLALRAVVRGVEASSALSSLLSWLMGADAGLAVFAGAVAGLLLHHGLPRDLHSHLVERLPVFEQEVNALGKRGRENLCRFTLSAIREVWGQELPAVLPG